MAGAGKAGTGADVSRIEWTDRTWNPTRGCSRVSEGCQNCYAERIAARFSGEPDGPFYAFARQHPARWTGRIELLPDKLSEPLHWRKPCRVFVNSMSDLFHQKLSDEEIDRAFAVMALAGRHTFQILTKRPERMLAYLERCGGSARYWTTATPLGWSLQWEDLSLVRFPLPNVWLGVSVEDQATADERIPLLLQTPAALRFVSYEPALEPVNLRLIERKALGWVIVGGESGPGARRFDVDWARDVIRQCRAWDVPCFVKQLGAHVTGPDPGATSEFDIGCRRTIQLRDLKGGDPSEWPADLRIREFPQ